jgi:hypothetical protein
LDIEFLPFAGPNGNGPLPSLYGITPLQRYCEAVRP